LSIKEVLNVIRFGRIKPGKFNLKNESEIGQFLLKIAT